MNAECKIETKEFADTSEERLYIESMYQKGYELKSVVSAGEYSISNIYYWVVTFINIPKGFSAFDYDITK